MRCYFLRDNKIEFVELLKPGPDAELIKQASDLYSKRNGTKYDRVEVWNGKRLVYRSKLLGRPPKAH